MFRNPTNIHKTTRALRRFYSSPNGSSNFKAVNSIVGPFTALNTEKFRQLAFVPEKPLLITSPGGDYTFKTFPAATKWFVQAKEAASQPRQYSSIERLQLNHSYLDQFNDTILPYELIKPASQQLKTANPTLNYMLNALIADSDPDATFHRFSAPLELFLLAQESISQLYIAQAQIFDLPKELREDLPTPNIVKQAGKGDIYDTNIWLGCPPTYTPLHKDPNPNLFVQLASRKEVRIFEPSTGREIFVQVQRQLGRNGRESMRGAEMMEGKERELLDEAVWGKDAKGGYTALVQPMDALFIPKGWWHSIKSVGDDVNASVNWWFR